MFNTNLTLDKNMTILEQYEDLKETDIDNIKLIKEEYKKKLKKQVYHYFVSNYKKTNKNYDILIFY